MLGSHIWCHCHGNVTPRLARIVPAEGARSYHAVLESKRGINSGDLEKNPHVWAGCLWMLATCKGNASISYWLASATDKSSSQSNPCRRLKHLDHIILLTLFIHVAWFMYEYHINIVWWMLKHFTKLLQQPSSTPILHLFTRSRCYNSTLPLTASNCVPQHWGGRPK